MKKIILSAAIVALAAASCTKSNDSQPAKQTETKVFINLEAIDNDGLTTTETPTSWVIVKQ
jgi:hypothetical protein